MVVSVSRDGEHRFSKMPTSSINLIAGLGVEGDAHAGRTVQHRARVAADATQLNLRQVHLMQAELFDKLREQGFEVQPGQLGENITTAGIDLLDLPRGTRLTLGPRAVVEVTGLRTPCRQIDAFRPRLLRAVLYRTADGTLVRKAGIMGIVSERGLVSQGDPVVVNLPAASHHPLDPV